MHGTMSAEAAVAAAVRSMQVNNRWVATQHQRMLICEISQLALTDFSPVLTTQSNSAARGRRLSLCYDYCQDIHGGKRPDASLLCIRSKKDTQLVLYFDRWERITTGMEKERGRRTGAKEDGGLAPTFRKPRKPIWMDPWAQQPGRLHEARQRAGGRCAQTPTMMKSTLRRHALVLNCFRFSGRGFQGRGSIPSVLGSLPPLVRISCAG